MLYPLTSPEPCEDLCLFFGTLGRYDPRHRLTEHLFGAVAEQAPRAFIPTSDYPLQAFADNGVLGRFDDSGEPSLIFLRLSLPGYVKPRTQFLKALGWRDIWDLSCPIPVGQNRLTFFAEFQFFHDLLFGQSPGTFHNQLSIGNSLHSTWIFFKTECQK
jgi:hypothetical protein